MLRALIAAAVLVAASSVAEADDGQYLLNVGSTGATSVRWRVDGVGPWQTATVVGGVAAISPSTGGDVLNIDMVGVPYGSANIPLDGYPLDTGDVTIGVGGLQFTTDGPKRNLSMGGYNGSTDFQQAFLQGVGQAFGAEDFAAMVMEANVKFSAVVGAIAGVFFVFLLLGDALRWVKYSIGGEPIPDDWKRHRKRGDEIMRGNEFEREVEDRVRDDADWGGFSEKAELDLDEWDSDLKWGRD